MSDAGWLTVRPMDRADLPGAVDASGEAFGVPLEDEYQRRRWTGRLAHLIGTDPGGVFVGERDGEIIGVAQACRRDRLWCLSLLAVTPRAGGAGAGRALLARALRYREPGDGALIVSSNDPRALALYAELGFSLHPTLRASGFVDRDALPPPDPSVRPATLDDLPGAGADLAGDPGAAHTAELHYSIGRGGQLIVIDERGFAVAQPGMGVWLLVALDEQAATALLWRALEIGGDTEAPIRWITGGQDWAVQVAVRGGLRLAGLWRDLYRRPDRPVAAVSAKPAVRLSLGPRAAGRPQARAGRLGDVAAENEISQQIERRRRAVAELWNLGDEAVVIVAGEPISIPGRADLTYRFRAHSEYFYLTDRERPGGALTFDAQEGWHDFVVPVSRDERVWEGGPADGDDGEPVSGLQRWLADREGRPVVWLGAQAPDDRPSNGLSGELRRGLNQVRRAKDEVELQRMRTAEAATRAGFALARPMLTPGTSERQVQVEMEAEFLRQGADLPAYETIVGGGPNSAVLHFAPSGRRFGEGELVLIDAGGEYRGYASDVTRTYPVSGEFSPVQAELHGVVQRALDEATARCRSGANGAMST